MSLIPQLLNFIYIYIYFFYSYNVIILPLWSKVQIVQINGGQEPTKETQKERKKLFTKLPKTCWWGKILDTFGVPKNYAISFHIHGGSNHKCEKRGIYHEYEKSEFHSLYSKSTSELLVRFRELKINRSWYSNYNKYSGTNTFTLFFIIVKFVYYHYCYCLFINNITSIITTTQTKKKKKKKKSL